MEAQRAATPSKVELRTVPLRLIEISPSVAIIKRGRTEVKIEGERAGEVVRGVLAVAAAGATADEICSKFVAQDRPAVGELIAKLQARGLLVSTSSGDVVPQGPESSLDVFYWHFGSNPVAVGNGLSKAPITIIGVNSVSGRLAAALAVDGARTIEVVHYPLLCNLRLLDSQGCLCPEEWPTKAPPPRDYKEWWDQCNPQALGCVVATSDFGGLDAMRTWNEFCVRNTLQFLPVVLQDLIGYIGPLVVPGETACFECLRARQNSNLLAPEIERAPELRSFEAQAIAGFHHSMAAVLGELAALELSRFRGGWAPPRVVGNLIEVNLVAPEMTTHRVLKVPRCRVCAEVGRHTAASAFQNTFLPGNEWMK